MRIYNRLYYYILPAVVILIVEACSSTKNLPPGDALYTGATITVRDSLISKKKKKAIKAELQPLLRPKPNSKILGMPIKLWIYNSNAKAKRFPGKFLREKLGEPPVLVSDVNLDRNVQVLQSHLQNTGYFNALVRGDTTLKKRKASASYAVRAGSQYHIKSVQFQGDSSTLHENIRQSMPRTFLKVGNPFNLEVITGERARIDNYLKERGFFYFNPEFLLIKADTTVGENQVDLFVTVKNETPDQAEKVYRIKDVFIYTGYSLNNAETDTNKRDAKFYKGYYLIDRRNFYKPKLFLQSMTFDQGDIYNRTDHNASISRLISMNIFKFVKNRFELANADSAQLNAYYYLTRLPKKSLRLEVNANTKSNNLTGSNITLGWRNRNTFRAGEQFVINASAGFEVQYSGQLQGFNTFRYGIEPALSFPRFLVPFFNFNTKGSFLPKTTIKIGYDLLTRQKLYTLNSFRAQYGYNWKENVQKEHELNPISINYIQPADVTDAFRDSASENPTLNKTIEKQFILGSEYNYTFSNLVNNEPANGFYFNGGIDLSGNIASLIARPNLAAGDTARLFGAAYSQFTRLQGDFRFYRRLGATKTVWANRIFVGTGIPYGNSRELPFIKQFFSGGNNSLRGFRSRSVGPGTYVAPDTTGGLLAEQSGDLKLELNTELRFPIVSVVNGALFVDAGNIWLWNENPLKPGAKFTNNFINELAVDAGVGIRIDITFLVLRLDVAAPIRKPWLTKGNQWVIDQIKLKNPDWRKENLVFNLGIGYPF